VTLSSISDLRENAAEEKAELDAKIALKRISLMLERVRLLRNPVGYARWESRMLPGVDTSVTIPIVGRLLLKRVWRMLSPVSFRHLSMPDLVAHRSYSIPFVRWPMLPRQS